MTPSKQSYGSLPSEVLSTIAQHLDPSSTHTFSLLSRRSAAIAEPFLWERVRITGGELSFARRLRSLLKYGSARRWGMVKSIQAAIPPASLHSFLQLLDLTQDHLESLEMVPTGHPDRDVMQRLDDFAVRLLLCGPRLSFPNLTHLRMVNVTQLAEFISCVGTLAPLLQGLDIEMAHDEYHRSAPPDSPLSTEIPLMAYGKRRNHHLTSLRLSYHGPWFDDIGRFNVQLAFAELLDCSPRIRQLSVQWGCIDDRDHDGEDVEGEIFTSLYKMEEVRDLYWQTEWKELPDRLIYESPLKWRRLMVKFDWAAEDIHIPISPTLEVIYFDCRSLDINIRPTLSLFLPFSDPAPTSYGLDHELHTWFWCNPSLLFVHFSRNVTNADNLAVFANLDGLDSPGRATAAISELQYGLSQVFHIRVLVQDISFPSFDVPNVGEAEGKRVEIKGAVYIAGNDSEDAEYGVIRSEPTVVHVSDWEGETVRIEVLERMRVEEGLSREAWERRGVKIGKQAWQVLLDWKESLLTLDIDTKTKQTASP